MNGLIARFVRPVLLGALAIALPACASTPRAGGSPCLLASADSSYLSGGAVYRDCAVDREARHMNPAVRVEFRPVAGPSVGSSICYAAEVRFVVGADGLPEQSGIRIVQSTDAMFARALAETVPRWRYRPATVDGEPVRQIVQERRVFAIAIAPVVSGSGSRLPPPRPNC